MAADGLRRAITASHLGPRVPTALCAKTWPMRLRSGAVVIPEHAAAPLSVSDRASSDRPDLGRDERVVQALVGPFLMSVVHERSDGGAEMRFAEVV